LTGLNLCNYLDRYILPAVLAPIERDLKLNDSQFGTIATIFMVGYFLTAPVFGYLGDRCSRRWLIAIGVAVWCAGTMLSGSARGLGALVCFRILVGIGEASYGTLSPGWIADLYPPEKRNNALSFFYIAIPVGSALGYIVGGGLASVYGWRTAFLVAGLPGLLLAALLLLVREPRRGASDQPESGRIDPGAERFKGSAPLSAALRSYGRLFKIRDYRLTVLGYVAQTFALGAFATYAVAFLERTHHLEYAAADRFFGTALVLTGLGATVVGGVCGTAWRKRSPAGYSNVLALSALAAIPVSFAAFVTPDIGWSKVCLVAAMFFLFLSTGPVNTLILETVPTAQRAGAMAASIFAIHLFGDLGSPKLVGWLSVRLGDLREAILLTLPMAIVVCAMFWTWLALAQRRRAAPSLTRAG
jgi:MFS family permease